MYEDDTHGLRARRDPNLRAADADRDATSEHLRRHHAEGRLDTEEFQERIERCYQAKTLGQLEQLLTDLPPEPTSEGRFGLRRVGMIGLLPIVIALVAISAGAHHHDGHAGFWLVIPLFFLLRFSLWRHGPWRLRRRGDAGHYRA